MFTFACPSSSSNVLLSSQRRPERGSLVSSNSPSLNARRPTSFVSYSSARKPLPALYCTRPRPVKALVPKGSFSSLNNLLHTNINSLSGSFSSLNNLHHTNINSDEKFRFNFRKDDVVEDIKKDGPVTKDNEDRDNRKPHSKLGPKHLVGGVVLVALGVCYCSFPKSSIAANHVVVPYSDLVGKIEDESVTRVQFVGDSRRILFNTKSFDDQINVKTLESDASATGLGVLDVLRKINKKRSPRWQYSAMNVYNDSYELIRILRDKGITYGRESAFVISPKAQLFFDVLSTLLHITPIWLSLFKIDMPHILGNWTKRKPTKSQSVKFEDVQGLDAAKAELLEVVKCIRRDSKYKKLGAKPPKGVLLVGPPGTGKTLLARAVAGEVGVPFFETSGSEFIEVYIGTGAARIRDLFKEARKHAPSIIFIDEIDAIGKKRGITTNSEGVQTLTQLLCDMDGFNKDENVVVIATTNRPETLDPALMRPGRFSMKVLVDKPNEEGRGKIFARYLRDVPMEEDKEEICSLVASLTPGLVGAHLEDIAKDSLRLAGRKVNLCRGMILLKLLREPTLRSIIMPKNHNRLRMHQITVRLLDLNIWTS